MDCTLLNQLSLRLFISCESLSHDEIVERMIKAKSRRAMGGERKQRKRKAEGVKVVKKMAGKRVTVQASKMDRLLELLKAGLSHEEAMDRMQAGE